MISFGRAQGSLSQLLWKWQNSERDGAGGEEIDSKR